MKNLLIFFLFVSNFIFSQNYFEIIDLKSFEKIDSYCNLISTNKNLKIKIIEGEIENLNKEVIGGFSIYVYKDELNHKKRILQHTSVKSSETIDCYFYNDEIVKVIIKEDKFENNVLKNLSTANYYLNKGSIIKTFGENICSDAQLKKKIEDVLTFLK
jgi:hypothetical protein